MKIKILIDNTDHPNCDYFTEHGLSIYFEEENKKWLLDLGATGLFSKNANRMGIDLREIDYVILSHAHADHCGGLEAFLNENNHAPVLLSSAIADNAYFSKRNGLTRHIGIDFSLIEMHNQRFKTYCSNQWITPNVAILVDIPNIYPTPKANQFLLHGKNADSFDHELAVLIRTNKGLVVFTGCAHRGLLNILHAAQSFAPELPILATIGGTHLIDNFETEEEIRSLTKSLDQYFPYMKLITGHCTGSQAKEIFTQTLAERLTFFHSGFECDVL